MKIKIVEELAQNWQNISPKNPELWAKWLSLSQTDKQALFEQIKSSPIEQNFEKMKDLAKEIEQDFAEIELYLKEIRKKITQKA
mgnify:CR=1 FL=1